MQDAGADERVECVTRGRGSALFSAAIGAQQQESELLQHREHDGVNDIEHYRIRKGNPSVDTLTVKYDSVGSEHRSKSKEQE
jgi:hypothetical protein